MMPFLDSFTGRLDKKGRVSVPADFRDVLKHLQTEEVVLRPSHLLPCIEAWPLSIFASMSAGLDRLDTFSDDETDLAFSLFAQATRLRPDAEGRVVLPAKLIAHAGLVEEVCFVGLGRRFQIWEPTAALRRTEEATKRARERGLTLPGPAAGGRV